MRSIAEVEARYALKQHGVVTRAQLRAAGFSGDVIDRRILSGRLLRLHRGVYLVGVVAPPYARELAACLACGPAAALSNGSAGVLWEMVKRSTRRNILEVSLRSGYRRRPGIRVYRPVGLLLQDVTRHRRVPVTTPARTVFDLAARMTGRVLERVVAEAVALRLTTVEKVADMADRQPWGRRATRLRAVLGLGDPRRTRSEAEEILLRLMEHHGVRKPAVNARVGGLEVDFYWEAERLAAEVDGRAFHSSPAAFERDRLRDADLAALGIRVVRLTWRQLTHDPAATIRRLEAALAVSSSIAWRQAR